MPFYATCVMHQVRLLEYLRLTPLPDCLAARTVRLQETCGPGQPAGPGTAAPYTPFVSRVLAEKDALLAAPGRDAAQREARCVHIAAPDSLHDIHPTVAVARRAVACRSAYAALPRAAHISKRQAARHVVTAASAVPAAPARESLAALYYNGQHFTLADLGTRPHITPMSIAGPGCGGSLLAVCTLNWRVTMTPMRMRMGRKAFAFMPFYGGMGASRNAVWEGADMYKDGNLQQRIARYSRPGPCPHCERDSHCGLNDGPYHLTVECPHGDLAELRKRMCDAAELLLPNLLRALTQRRNRHLDAGRDDDDEEEAEDPRRAELANLLDRTDWSSADGKHVLFHLLTVLPWTETVATADTPLSAWQGRVFDDTCLARRYRRSPADMVVRWASHWGRAFAGLRWRLLMEAHALDALASP